MTVFYLILQLAGPGVIIPEPYPSRDACIEAAKTASRMVANAGQFQPSSYSYNFACVETRKNSQ